MNKVKTQVGMTFLAGLSLILLSAISLGLFGRAPSILSPGAILLVIPLMIWTPVFFVILIPAVFFWLWSSYLFQGLPNLPKRTKILGYIIAALSLFYFASSWSYGVRYQGLLFTIVCAATSVAFVVIFIVVVRRNEKNSSFASNLLATWLLFVWVFTYAFPYLGETP
jgi:hypothetical protein